MSKWFLQQFHKRKEAQGCVILRMVGFTNSSVFFSVSFSRKVIDTEDVSKEDLAGLFPARWNNELDLRTIKITLQMDILRCESPELVRKKIWPHILAYHLIRTIIAQAANKHDIL